MNKVWLILQKEITEILQQRILLFTIALFPLFMIGSAGYLLANPLNGVHLPISPSDPRFAGLASFQIDQMAIGSMFRVYLLAQPLLIPAVIAAYSIVGEKNNRTLEPLLAAPVRTWQLLVAKCLSAMIPAVAVTWISGGIFIAEVARLASPVVFQNIITPGWLLILILTVPVLVITPVALTVMISSRVNDPRTASQVSSLIFIVLVLAFSLFGSGLVFSPTLALIVTMGLALIGGGLVWGATRVFQREAILTRWS
jgi:ABC-2 type transport system permease protein